MFVFRHFPNGFGLHKHRGKSTHKRIHLEVVFKKGILVCNLIKKILRYTCFPIIWINSYEQFFCRTCLSNFFCSYQNKQQKSQNRQKFEKWLENGELLFYTQEYFRGEGLESLSKSKENRFLYILWQNWQTLSKLSGNLLIKYLDNVFQQPCQASMIVLFCENS